MSDNDILPHNRKSPGLMRRIRARIRLVPVVIFVSVMMLSVRVNDIWLSVEGLMQGELSVAKAQAQSTEEPAVDEGEADLAETDVIPQELSEEALDSLMAADPLEMPDDDDTASVAARMLADDPTLLTQTEIDLLQKLAERREEIDLRTRELETREAVLQAAESRIDQKIDDFKVLKDTLDGLIITYDGQQDAQVGSLVKIYENMKPKDAARIFEELEMTTLLMVVERMKERSLAPVMAKMNPVKAREVTVELSRLRRLPSLSEGGG